MRKVIGVAIGVLLSTLAVTPASAGAQRCPGTIQLDDKANGRHLRVCKGTRITVLLHAPDLDHPGTWWQPITADGRAVRPDPYHPRILPARGVTAGFFKAGHRGRATLRSTRRICAPDPAGPTCHATMAWQVEVAI
jgi:hypothetical protein